MCGIVGYIGNKKCIPILINGLLKLEYRGYDSAGVATIQNNSIIVVKDKGRVANLQCKEELNTLNTNIGIAHTRWSTHGKPSKTNAHPHTDNLKKFAVVHNGIIENYLELKDFLIHNGYTLYSETDTEVIPNLIDYYFRNDSINDEMKFLRAVKNTCIRLNGSYAIEVISSFYPDTIITVRKDSPLVIGTSINENFIASDIPAILEYTNNFYFLEDNEFAIISKDKIKFFDNNLVEHFKNFQVVNIDNSSIDKNGFEDYMLKEIYEQPIAVKKSISNRLNIDENSDFSKLNFTKDYLSKINNIYIVACGTAMHAGLCGKTAIETLCKIPVTVDIASEFRYREPLIDENTLCIFISQSGETADTIAALKLAKHKNSKTIAITNVLNSSITREADFSIYTYAGTEIAVASTKAYTSQVVLLICLAAYFAEILKTTNKETLNELKKEIFDLPNKIDNILLDISDIKKASKKFATKNDFFFLGRGIDYITSLEGSLKLKEISYIHSEAFPAGELKHGPIALIEEGTPVVCTITDSNLLSKTISNIEEVISRGAKTIIITSEAIKTLEPDLLFTIPKTHKLLTPILSIIPLQLLSYYIAKEKGLDIDKPRNLAKSVTVE